MSDSFIMYRNPVEAAVWDSIMNGFSNGGASIWFSIMILFVSFVGLIILYKEIIIKKLTLAQQKKVLKFDSLIYFLLFILSIFVAKIVKIGLLIVLDLLFQILAFI